MLNRREALAASIAAALSPLGSFAQSGRVPRLALVIGNSAYQAVAPLRNALNDARAMGGLLRAQGFEVVQVLDGSRQQMLAAIAEAQARLSGRRGVGLLYYAGHGLQIAERNFLVPVDARIAKAADVPEQAVDVQAAIDAYRKAGCRMNILVLDACRDNPFGTGTLKGLAPLDAPAGTFIAYATAPGNVAEDGEAEGNGLYTSFLLQELKRPKARIEEVFKRVRYHVRQKSSGRQIPWESTSLEEEFIFDEGQVATIVPPTTAEVQRTFPAELEAWNRIAASRNPADFYAFVQRYPDGSLTLMAQGRIEELQRSGIVVQGGGADRSDAPVWSMRFARGQSWALRTVIGPTVTETRRRVLSVDAQGCVIELVNVLADGKTTPPSHLLFSPSGAALGLLVLDERGQRVGESRHDVPSHLVPPGLLQVGQRWDIREIQRMNFGAGAAAGQSAGTTVINGQGRVEAREPVTVTAGTFEAFRVSRRLELNVSMTAAGQAVRSGQELHETHWVSPALPWPVKSVVRVRVGADWTEQSSELLRFSRA